jgi:putative transposase
VIVGIPPPCRNQRAPTAEDTPTFAAASSEVTPFAISFQNCRSTLRRVFGAPGEIIAERPVNSLNHPAGLPIITPHIRVLRRPVESAQYRAIRYTERLEECEAVASVGSKGDSYDNAMAEALNSLYKAELIRNIGPWEDIEDVEKATAEWVGWYNTERLHGELGHVPPVEHETAYWAVHKTQKSLANTR